MTKIKLAIGLILLATASFGQSITDSLVQIGKEYHEHGYYEDAIAKYQEALAIDPASAMAHYEVSVSYLSIEDYDNAIQYSSKAIALDDQFALQAYVVKGSALGYLGKSKESIKLFKKGIRKYGDQYFFNYNLGYNYYHLKQYKKAEEALVKAIRANPHHASSHLLLAYVMHDMRKTTQSLLSLYYFLLLEPDSERASAAHQLLMQQFGGNVKKSMGEPNQVNIALNANADHEFGAAAMMVSMLEASNSLAENAGKSEGELFVKNTTSFFKILGELKQKDSKGFHWEYYVPFFYEIAQSAHIDTYCYYISQLSGEESLRWLQHNMDKVEQFDQWLKTL